MNRRAVRHVAIAALGVWFVATRLAVGQEPPPPRPTFPPVRPLVSPPPRAQEVPSPRLPTTPATPAARPGATGKPATVQRVQPTSEQIAAWIRELDADEFLTRETASLQLLEAGPAVLPALKPVLTGGSLEATSRALFVVRQIGLAADIDTQDQA